MYSDSSTGREDNYLNPRQRNLRALASRAESLPLFGNDAGGIRLSRELTISRHSLLYSAPEFRRLVEFPGARWRELSLGLYTGVPSFPPRCSKMDCSGGDQRPERRAK